MIKIAKEQVKSWNPCNRYTDDDFALLDRLYGDKEILTLDEILLLDEVSPEDILWLLLREEIIGEKI